MKWLPRILVLVMVLCSYSKVFACDGVTHIKAWETMKNVSINEGGISKGISHFALQQFQNTIDTTGGSLHRHDGSHFYKYLLSEKGDLIKDNKITIKEIKNMVAIHNILDMQSGTTGTNGWKWTQGRAEQARILAERIMAGKPIKIPFWAIEKGTEIIPNISAFDKAKNKAKEVYRNTLSKISSKCSNVKNKFISNSYAQKILSKVSVVVDNTPSCVKQNLGTVIYVTYEGATMAYRFTKGTTDIEKEIVRVVSISVSTIVSIGVMKGGLIVLAPLETIPAVGAVCHIGGATIMSVGSAFLTDYIVREGINYVSIKYL